MRCAALRDGGAGPPCGARGGAATRDGSGLRCGAEVGLGALRSRPRTGGARDSRSLRARERGGGGTRGRLHVGSGARLRGGVPLVAAAGWYCWYCWYSWGAAATRTSGCCRLCACKGQHPGVRLVGIRGPCAVRAEPGPFCGTAVCPTDTLCPQWPYCRKHCSYCSFNKYVVPAVDEAAVRACLVREAQTLLRLGHVRRWVPALGPGGRGVLQRPPAASQPSPQRHLRLLRWGHPQPGRPAHHRRRAGGGCGGRLSSRWSRGDAGGQPRLR